MKRYGRPFQSDPRVEVDLEEDGVLYMINQVLFHPRGYALATDKAGKFLLMGDGAERWHFAEGEREVGGKTVDESADNDKKWAAFNALLERAKR